STATTCRRSSTGGGTGEAPLRPARPPRPTTCSSVPQVDAGCLVANVAPEIAAHHGFQPRHEARGAFPDLGLVGIEPQQDDVGVVSAALVPGGDAAAPQLVD